MIHKLRWNNGKLEALIATEEWEDDYIYYELGTEWQPVPDDYFASPVETNKEII